MQVVRRGQETIRIAGSSDRRSRVTVGDLPVPLGVRSNPIVYLAHPRIRVGGRSVIGQDAASDHGNDSPGCFRQFVHRLEFALDRLGAQSPIHIVDARDDHDH